MLAISPKHYDLAAPLWLAVAAQQRTVQESLLLLGTKTIHTTEHLNDSKLNSTVLIIEVFAYNVKNYQF